MPSPALAAFVSYSRDDSKFVVRLVRDLKAAGISVWLDQLDIRAGEPWDRTIEEALSAATQVLLILSPASARSENVRDEISFALNKGRAVIPVLYRDCEIPLRLQRSHQIDFRSNYAAGLQALTARLQNDAEQTVTATARPLLTRRRILIAGGAAAVVATGGGWWQRDRLSDVFHPLPTRRYVALMAWPPGDSPSLVATVLRSIGDRMARAEKLDHNLLSIAPANLLSADATVTSINPAQAVTALGVNLVMGASLTVTRSMATLTLDVLEAATERILRRRIVERPAQRISELVEAGPAAASAMLGLPEPTAPLKDQEELQNVSPQVLQFFSDAEILVAQPNRTGLQAAILKYQQAVDADTHFALGFARLAMAYVQQYLGTSDPAPLKLAAGNSQLALHFNPDSAAALISQAQMLIYSGKPDDAFAYFRKCLAVDPGNPDALTYEAQAYRFLNKLPEAASTYEQILSVRPNYWLAYNELGWLKSQEGDYHGAIDAFQSAAAASPQVSLPLANLASIYLKLGRHDEAVSACNNSLKRTPNYAAYRTLGDIAFTDKKYVDALADYQKAAVLFSNDHNIWRDIGDCYQVLGQPALVQQNYSKAAQLLSARMVLYPKSKAGWATLAFYHAKTGDTSSAQKDLDNAGPPDKLTVASQLLVIQVFALQGRKEDAIKLLLAAFDRGLLPSDVDLSLDLHDLQKDPRYIARVQELQSRNRAKAS